MKDTFTLIFTLLLLQCWCRLCYGLEDTDIDAAPQPRFLFNSSTCGGRFQCTSGECIDANNVCNGASQCPDDSDESPESCDCGLARTSEFSAEDQLDLRYSIEGQHPWHAGIYIQLANNQIKVLCSGALIYDEVVLTAAHCLIDAETGIQYPTPNLRVNLGKLKIDINYPEKNQQDFRVREVDIMANYNDGVSGYSHDLAIVKLRGTIVRTPSVTPICLWSEKRFPPSVKRVQISGWALQSFSAFSVNLRYVSGTYMDVRTCRIKYLDSLIRAYLTNDKFCLTFEDRRASSNARVAWNTSLYGSGASGKNNYKSKSTSPKWRPPSKTNIRPKFTPTASKPCDDEDCFDGSGQGEVNPKSDSSSSGVTIKGEDAGGPVTIYYQGRHYLVGILSKQFTSDYGLAISIGRYAKWIRHTVHELFLAEICLHHRHFNCIGDSKCIRMFKVCDGKQDCKDNSDEDPKLCKTITTTTTTQPSLTVHTSISPYVQPTNTDFRDPNNNKPRCILPQGVEIFKMLKCGDSSGCRNNFTVPSNSIFQLTCPPGYGFTKPNTDAIPVICSEGIWIPSLKENMCLSLCKLETQKTLELSCNFQGNLVSCYDLMKPGTQISVACRRHYKKKPLVRYINSTFCRRDGIIQHELSTCVPVCGEPFDLAALQTLISNGETLRYAKYPWHVAVYWKEDLKDGTQGKVFSYKCGGTLIDSNKVLTAAHCVWRDQKSSMVEPEIVFVICGKLHSSWLIRDDWEQRAEVSKIYVGTHYVGAKTKYSQDIAVLQLNKEIELSSNVMPACIDWDLAAGGIPNNQLGHIIGWGSTTASENTPSQVLQETWMRFLDLDACRKRFERQDFTEYLHPDKFCALYTNGSGTQVGDSGGGMTFVHDNLHYIYGIVSVKKADQNDFAVFTNLLFHLTWLQDIMKNN